MEYKRAKHLVERVAAAAAVGALAPLLGGLALAVKATSRGPALYQPARLGTRGSVFRMLKFRSMSHDAPMVVNADSKTVVEAGDPRLTPIGKFLRWGFDELPQLVNVARGEMSIVGPRPDADWMLPRYTPTIMRRLGTRPGITGLSQVCDVRGRRIAMGYLLDCYYVEHESLALDLRILAWTALYLAGHKRVGDGLVDHILRQPGFDRVEDYEPRPSLAAGG